jgi:hypothetical protein
MSVWYGVRIHGGPGRKEGIYTTRFVEADTGAAAAESVKLAISTELDVLRPGEEWSLEIDEIWTCPSRPESGGQGFTWYRE